MIYSLVWGCSGEGRSPWPAKNFWTRVLRLVRNLGLNRFVPARSWRLLGQLCLFVGREAPNNAGRPCRPGPRCMFWRWHQGSDKKRPGRRRAATSTQPRRGSYADSEQGSDKALHVTLQALPALGSQRHGQDSRWLMPLGTHLPLPTAARWLNEQKPS